MINRSISMPPHLWDALAERALRTDRRVADQIREAVVKALEAERDPPPKRQLPLLGAAPAGPLMQAIQEARHVDLGETAEVLRVQDDDFLMEVKGESMVSDNPVETIPDGSWLLFRPGGHPEGEVVLCRVTHNDGAVTYTIKRWMGGDGVKLVNGRHQPVELPKDVVELFPVAVKRGIVASAGKVMR